MRKNLFPILFLALVTLILFPAQPGRSCARMVYQGPNGTIISSPTEPNISSTRWRTVADHKNRIYYFDNVLNPNVVWVDVSKIDLSEKGKVRTLPLDNNQNYSGKASMLFSDAKPFRFTGLD